MNETIAGVTCGNCSKRAGRPVKHASVAAVRACYAGPVEPVMSDREEARLIQAAERAESERVAAYKAERDSRQIGGGDPNHPDAWDGGRHNRTGFIGGNKQSPSSRDPWGEVRALQRRLPNLPSMHYAIQDINYEVSPEPVWKFYKIDKPAKGRWVGRTFVNVQAGDDYHPVRGPERLISVLTAILHDPAKAAANYGHQIGKCGICNRTLTDEASIARGIGPVCADKVGW